MGHLIHFVALINVFEHWFAANKSARKYRSPLHLSSVLIAGHVVRTHNGCARVLVTEKITATRDKGRWHGFKLLRVLFENRPALYFCNYTENEKKNTRMLDTLFIDGFIDIMED